MSRNRDFRCTEVSTFCPVSATTYGYYPNFGASVFFCATFGLFALAQLFLGVRYKAWTWMIATVIGTTMECVGFIGRIMLNRNPWDGAGFRIQIVCLILAPSLMSASIDLTLKHIVIVFGDATSRIRPGLYTWVFIGLDVASIVIQAIGGAVAAGATGSGSVNRTMLDVGNNLMLAGIIVQVAQLIAFALVAADYIWRTKKYYRTRPVPEIAQYYLASTAFRGFCIAVTVAFCAILIRCIYRIPEMAGGWGGPIQRDEISFLVLDSAMVWIAACVLTIWHPGYCFPQLCKKASDLRVKTKPKKELKREKEQGLVGQEKPVAERQDSDVAEGTENRVGV